MAFYRLPDESRLHLVTCASPEFRPSHAARLHFWADKYEVPLIVLGINDERISRTGFFPGYRLLLLREFLATESRTIPSRSGYVRKMQHSLNFESPIRVTEVNKLKPLLFGKSGEEQTRLLQEAQLKDEAEARENKQDRNGKESSGGFEVKTAIRDDDLIVWIDDPRSLAFNRGESLDEISNAFNHLRGDVEMVFAGRYELPPELSNHAEFFPGKALQRRLAFLDSSLWVGRAGAARHFLNRYPFTYKTNDRVWWQFRLLAQTHPFFADYDGTSKSPCLKLDWCRAKIRDEPLSKSRQDEDEVSEGSLSPSPSPDSDSREGKTHGGPRKRVSFAQLFGETAPEERERDTRSEQRQMQTQWREPRIMVDRNAALLAIAGGEEAQKRRFASNWSWNDTDRHWSLRLDRSHSYEVTQRKFTETLVPRSPYLLSLNRDSEYLARALQLRDESDLSNNCYPFGAWLLGFLFSLAAVIAFAASFGVFYSRYKKLEKEKREREGSLPELTSTPTETPAATPTPTEATPTPTTPTP